MPYEDPHPTSPSEIMRLAGDEHNFRLFVIREMTAEKEWRRHFVAENKRWREEVEKKIVIVSSGVGDYNETKSEFNGARKLIIGVVAVVAAIGGCILFALEVARWLK